MVPRIRRCGGQVAEVRRGNNDTVLGHTQRSRRIDPVRLVEPEEIRFRLTESHGTKKLQPVIKLKGIITSTE